MSNETKFTLGEWKYGVRRDGSIWISRGNPATGPHYQSDFCGTVHDAAVTCAAPALYEAALVACLMFERKNVSAADCDWLGDDEHEAWSALGKAMALARGEKPEGGQHAE